MQIHLPSSGTVLTMGICAAFESFKSYIFQTKVLANLTPEILSFFLEQQQGSFIGEIGFPCSA